jgi:hypothetical protein
MNATENPNEGNPVEAKVEVPTPTFEETPGQPLGNSFESLQGRLETFEKNVLGQLKALQGDKDRRIPKLEGSLQEVMSEITRLKGHGFSDEEAINEVEFRQNVKDLAQKIKGVEQPTGNGAAQEAQFNIVKELTAYGLDTNDPDVLKLVSGRYRNADHFRAEAATLALRKSTPSTPSDTVSPAPTGSGINPPSGAELVGEYKTKMKSARGNRTLLASIREEYGKKGVDVHNVDFT